MRTYELMFVVDPRVSDEDVVTMMQDYKNMITAGGSEITSEENWGRRKLAYPIENLAKAHYVMLNIEVGQNALNELESGFRFNDAVLRHLVIKRDEADVEPSFILKSKEKDDAKSSRRRDDDSEGEGDDRRSRGSRDDNDRDSDD